MHSTTDPHAHSKTREQSACTRKFSASARVTNKSQNSLTATYSRVTLISSITVCSTRHERSNRVLFQLTRVVPSIRVRISYFGYVG